MRRMSPRRLSALLLLVVCSLFVAACGGDDKDSADDRGYTTARGYGDPKASLAAADFSPREGLGGEPFDVTASYQPTGDIVADSGFRPYSDGFAFPTYGNDAGPTNLGPKEMQ